jgi:hypothetical protein
MSFSDPFKSVERSPLDGLSDLDIYALNTISGPGLFMREIFFFFFFFFFFPFLCLVIVSKYGPVAKI